MAQWNPMNDFMQGYGFMEGIKDAREDREWKRNRRKRQEVVDQQQDEVFARTKELWGREDVLFDQSQEDRAAGILASGVLALQLGPNGEMYSSLDEALRKHPDRVPQFETLLNSPEGQLLLNGREGVKKGRRAVSTGRFMPDGKGGVVPEIQQVDEKGDPVSTGPLTMNGTTAEDDPNGADQVVSLDARTVGGLLTPGAQRIVAMAARDPRFFQAVRQDLQARAERGRQQAQRDAAAALVGEKLKLNDLETADDSAFDSMAAMPTPALGAPPAAPAPTPETPSAPRVAPVSIEAAAGPATTTGGYPVTYRNTPHDAEYYGRRARETVDHVTGELARGAKIGAQTLYDALGRPVVDAARTTADAAGGFARGLTGSAEAPAQQPAAPQPAATQPAPRQAAAQPQLTEQQQLNRVIARQKATAEQKAKLRKAGMDLIRKGGDANAVLKLLDEPELEKHVFEKSGTIVYTDKKGNLKKTIKVPGVAGGDPTKDLEYLKKLSDLRGDVIEAALPDENERAYYRSAWGMAASSGVVPLATTADEALIRKVKRILDNEADSPFLPNLLEKSRGSEQFAGQEEMFTKAVLAAELGYENLSGLDNDLGQAVANVIEHSKLNVAPSDATQKAASVISYLMREYQVPRSDAISAVRQAIANNPNALVFVASNEPRAVAEFMVTGGQQR